MSKCQICGHEAHGGQFGCRECNGPCREPSLIQRRAPFTSHDP
jgi:hypothetical protein